MAESDTNSASATLIGNDDGSDAAPRLCHDCKRINLSVDKFLIGNRGANNGSDDAADVVEATGKIRLASGNAKRVLGNVRILRERCKICRLCELAWRAIGRYSGADAVGESADVFLTWEVDGRQRVPESDRLVNRTRRIRLMWTELSGKEENVYLVFVARAGPHMLNSDAYATKATHTHFLGRGPSENKERQALMKSWVDLCVDKHGPDCQNKHGGSSEFTKLLNSTYFGVIDVVDMQLKRLPVNKGVPERYVALSYVWGKRPAGLDPYITKRENVMRHIQHGGLEKEWDKLPRTIQDSILLVSRLGERYIWIDSLCIVQDEDADWAVESKKMAGVYSGAVCTIAATASESGDGGCYRDRDTLALQPVEIGVVGGGSGLEVVYLQCDDVFDFERCVDRAPLNRRGWVFQEWLLSRRILHFGARIVYWECRQRSATEVNPQGYVYKKYPDDFVDNYTPTLSGIYTRDQMEEAERQARGASWSGEESIRLRPPPPVGNPDDDKADRVVSWVDGRRLWKDIRKRSSDSWVDDGDDGAGNSNSGFRAALDLLLAGRASRVRHGRHGQLQPQLVRNRRDVRPRGAHLCQGQAGGHVGHLARGAEGNGTHLPGWLVGGDPPDGSALVRDPRRERRQEADDDDALSVVVVIVSSSLFVSVASPRGNPDSHLPHLVVGVAARRRRHRPRPGQFGRWVAGQVRPGLGPRPARVGRRSQPRRVGNPAAGDAGHTGASVQGAAEEAAGQVVADLGARWRVRIMAPSSVCGLVLPRPRGRSGGCGRRRRQQTISPRLSKDYK